MKSISCIACNADNLVSDAHEAFICGECHAENGELLDNFEELKCELENAVRRGDELHDQLMLSNKDYEKLNDELSRLERILDEHGIDYSGGLL
jgi:predicted nuclease with TOPRIM domain